MAVGFRGAVLERGWEVVCVGEEVGAVEERFGALIVEGWRGGGCEKLGGKRGACG